MNKREAIQAMLEGKKIRQNHWSKDYYISMNDCGTIYNSASTMKDLNGMWRDGWEVYEEPKPKTKYYRRKWIKLDDMLITHHRWCETKEGFDEVWEGDEMSPDWEEIEI